MRNFIVCLLILLSVSCEKKQPDLILSGTIKDLKKGTLYLERFQDTAFQIIDSATFQGINTFKFELDLPEAEVLFLRLNKSKDENNALAIFADKGAIDVSSTLKNFVLDAKISGSKQQDILEEYLKTLSRFNEKNLDIIKEQLDLATQDSTYIIEYDEQYNKLIRSKYLYTINFALSHKDSEVAPYLALTEIPDANIKYLDTIYKVLTPEIKDSRYGLELKKVLDEFRSLEN
ncbi:DUF4369 domain-containing protein [Paucihalobacter ruber]|uniref:DUF4369 domain-containing protein n=1 Tax=Paucihalobacter ruber TaxID=2567861 RepID=A0A506PPJ3_9FLAO|nr:DUF4369 domain-containing protein [Paucihalobacter ruber]TPV35498.1 DUF4369 domain-containing protein [Paucihalobacter ruber]